jgi:hypothetical protein
MLALHVPVALKPLHAAAPRPHPRPAGGQIGGKESWRGPPPSHIGFGKGKDVDRHAATAGAGEREGGRRAATQPMHRQKGVQT